ncbi:hypothetical protein DBR12_01835 [Acidovorax sp. HMWF029]|uniref:hypothetical protein n=1 Tax=Acidovorax sp. HMWF029 TaxID=2056863 RepID=UPI000D3A8389|nr:hypothetical protein [Acidovorax sp. HMWF029]PTT23314.1 hypothetical protein DBR12_01835 [Acidovorax sp. HMWF029]
MKLLTQRLEAVLHGSECQSTARKISTMDWVPIVFIMFKVAVFGTGMFFAIKWHYDQGKKAKNEAGRSQMLAERRPGASE